MVRDSELTEASKVCLLDLYNRLSDRSVFSAVLSLFSFCVVGVQSGHIYKYDLLFNHGLITGTPTIIISITHRDLVRRSFSFPHPLPLPLHLGLVLDPSDI